MSCTDIHKPAVDNNYETCLNGYESTDCVVPSRYMDLSGLSLPAGASNVESQANTRLEILNIVFQGYATNDNPFSAVLANNGWVLDEDSSWQDETECYFVYHKGNKTASYGWGQISGSAFSVYKTEYAE